MGGIAPGGVGDCRPRSTNEIGLDIPVLVSYLVGDAGGQARTAAALPLATFDRDQRRYGIPAREP